MSLALWPQVVSQAPQHFRSSEKQATSEGCLACQSVCSVISLHSGMSRAVHPKEFWKVDVEDVQRVHQAVYMLSTRDYNAALSHRQTPRKQNYTSAQYHTLQDPNRQTPRRQNIITVHNITTYKIQTGRLPGDKIILGHNITPYRIQSQKTKLY